MLVKKKDGSTRFCVDYCKVNEVTRKDAYPIPRVDDTLDAPIIGLVISYQLYQPCTVFAYRYRIGNMCKQLADTDKHKH